jgi:Domain of unknown function (DUF4129)
MRGSASRVLVPAVVVLGLVAVVAIAARGSTETGESTTRRPSDMLLDAFFSFILVAFIPAAAILIWGLMQRREIANHIAAGRIPRTGLLTLFSLLLAAAFLSWRYRDARGPDPDQPGDPIYRGQETPVSDEERGVVTTQYDPEFAWIPVTVVVGLVVVAFVAWRVSARRRRRAVAQEESTARVLADVLDETLDDLRAESDPRKAVIAAYARLERTLAAERLPRKAAETPEEYLRRILRNLEVDPASVRRLTDLFTWAKFSAHDVDVAMKTEAIDALAGVRDELRAADERRRQEDLTRLETAVQQP